MLFWLQKRFIVELCHSKHISITSKKTGKTPNQFIALAKAKGFDDPATKSGIIVDWLKEDFDLGRGHAMALVHVIKNGAVISGKHVNTGTAHSDPSNKLKLDGKNN